MGLSRLDLVRKLMSLGLPRAHADQAVSVVLGTIADGIAGEGKVAIRGFGTFLLKASRRAVMFDPRAGKVRNVSGRALVRFRPSRRFEDELGGPGG